MRRLLGGGVRLRGGVGAARRLLSSAAAPPPSPPPPAITDETVRHVAALSHLHLEPGTAAFDEARESLSAVLAWTRVVEGVAHEAAAASAAAGHAAGAPAAGCAPSPEEDAAFEALAERRFAELRCDAVTEGGDPAALLRHASRTSEGHFVVPRVLGE